MLAEWAEGLPHWRRTGGAPEGASRAEPNWRRRATGLPAAEPLGPDWHRSLSGAAAWAALPSYGYDARGWSNRDSGGGNLAHGFGEG